MTYLIQYDGASPRKNILNFLTQVFSDPFGTSREQVLLDCFLNYQCPLVIPGLRSVTEAVDENASVRRCCRSCFTSIGRKIETVTRCSLSAAKISRIWVESSIFVTGLLYRYLKF